MIRINCAGVGLQNPLAMALEVVELAAVECPGEYAEDAQHQDGGHGNQQEEDVHAAPYLASRSEFSTTNSELVAMPRPAAHGGSQPTSASGTQAAL